MSSEDQVSSSLANLALSPPVAVEQSPPSLLSLPDELLEAIFDFIFDAERRDRYRRPCPPECAHKAVCRRLWPMQQRSLYKHIELANMDRLELLARALVDKPPLGLLVKHLSLGREDYTDWADSIEAQYYTIVTSGMMAVQCLSRLFGALGALEKLSVHLSGDGNFDDDSLERAVLWVVALDPSTPVKLRELRYLMFHALGLSAAQAVTDNAAVFMAQFTRFSALETLDLTVIGKFPTSMFFGALSAPLVLENLSDLSVYANFTRWDLSLDAVAPDLVWLEVMTEDIVVRPIISRAPTGLHGLAIWATPHEAIDDLLPAFPHLTYVVSA